MIWLFAHPLHPLHPLQPSASSIGDTQEYRVRETTCWQEGVSGWARSQIIRPEERLVQWSSINSSIHSALIIPATKISRELFFFFILMLESVFRRNFIQILWLDFRSVADIFWHESHTARHMLPRPFFAVLTNHVPINYTDTKAKCRHLKNGPIKGLCVRCLSVWGPLPSFDPIPPLHLTHCIRVYCLLIHPGKGGGERANQRRGNSSQSWVENTNMTDCVSPVYKLW